MNIYKYIFVTIALATINLFSLSCKPRTFENKPNKDIDTTISGQMEAIQPIHNPERGFYMENMFYASNLKSPFNQSLSYSKDWIGGINKRDLATNDKLSLIQLYIYLTPYVKTSIADSAFGHMQELFDDAKKAGYKFVLRFAYDTDYGETNANFNDVFRHLDELRRFIEKNIGLIYVWERGFIGPWGEGHNSSMSNDWQGQSRMARKELDMFPRRQITIRYPNKKDSLVLYPEYLTRIGYNNDFFTASEHPMAPGNDYVIGTDAYKQVLKESPYLQVVGEMPYNEGGQWGLNKDLNIWKVLETFRDHHYTSFSVSHNLTPNIAYWKGLPISMRDLKSHDILYDTTYFIDRAGRYCDRSAYDFIRDHLGYRLVLDTSTTKLDVHNGTLNYDIQFKNVGFSAIHNPRPVYLVLIDTSGQIVQSDKLATDPSTWQPYDPDINNFKALLHNIKGNISLNIASGRYKVGLWLPDPTDLLKHNPEYAIEFANSSVEKWVDSKNQYKVNIIGTITL